MKYLLVVLFVLLVHCLLQLVLAFLVFFVLSCAMCACFSCFRFVGSLWNMYSFICAVGCLVVKQLIKSFQGDHFEE